VDIIQTINYVNLTNTFYLTHSIPDNFKEQIWHMIFFTEYLTKHLQQSSVPCPVWKDAKSTSRKKNVAFMETNISFTKSSLSKT